MAMETLNVNGVHLLVIFAAMPTSAYLVTLTPCRMTVI